MIHAYPDAMLCLSVSSSSLSVKHISEECIELIDLMPTLLPAIHGLLYHSFLHACGPDRAGRNGRALASTRA